MTSLKDRQSNSISFRFFIAFAIASLGISIGCSSTNSAAPKPPFSGNTNVTVLLSSTANDQLVQFAVGITGITLTTRSGKTVTLFSEPQGSQQLAEFIHINGGATPLISQSVPQGLYTSASVTVGQSFFACATLTPSGGLDTSEFFFGTDPTNAPAATVTVNLPSPITVTGSRMGLLLDLQVAESVTYQTCFSQVIQPFSVTPTFNLTPVSFAAQATNRTNGKVNELEGEVSTVGSSGNTLAFAWPDDPLSFLFTANSNTVFQGINGVSDLAVGTFATVDGAVQADGSILASRVAVHDATVSNVSVLQGPIVQVATADPAGNKPAGWVFGTRQQGFFEDNHEASITMPYEFSNAEFQISGGMTNLQNLPFAPSFNSSNMVAGQNVFVTTHATQQGSPAYIPVATVTLLPQTINGTVTGVSQAGSFTDYTVSLAPYDLFPALAVQQGQTTLLNSPNQVEVYVDNNTQTLNTQAAAPGNTLRFNGMIFNDNGTLRMDCSEIDDGVTATSTPNSAAQMTGATASRWVQRNSGGIQHIITTVTRSGQK